MDQAGGGDSCEHAQPERSAHLLAGVDESGGHPDILPGNPGNR
jgi:hypothetical protein